MSDVGAWGVSVVGRSVWGEEGVHGWWECVRVVVVCECGG